MNVNCFVSSLIPSDDGWLVLLSPALLLLQSLEYEMSPFCDMELVFPEGALQRRVW